MSNITGTKQDGGHGLRRQLVNGVWFGATSFEERCIGSLRELKQRGIRLRAVIVINYVKPQPNSTENEKRKNTNTSLLTEIGNEVADQVIVVNQTPYSFPGICTALQNVLTEFKKTPLLLDLSCFTRMHIIALSDFISLAGSKHHISLAYTSPENYSTFRAKPRDAWKDLLIFPLGEPKGGGHDEIPSRGIILPGHEGDRLQLSLAEAEPSGGSILIADTPQRPDWRHACERRNASVINRLTSSALSDWRIERVTYGRMKHVSAIVQVEVDHALTSGSCPAVVFPFGPKWMLFAATSQLSRKYRDHTWFVYAVPTKHDDYSEGVGATLWSLYRPPRN